MSDETEITLQVTRHRSILWDCLTAEQQQAVRDLDARADEIIVPDVLGSGYPATLRTAIALESDHLLYGNSYTKIGAGGLLERIPAASIRIPPATP